MDRIILVDSRFEDIALLKACFEILFPECEVQTISSGAELPGEGCRVREDEAPE